MEEKEFDNITGTDFVVEGCPNYLFDGACSLKREQCKDCECRLKSLAVALAATLTVSKQLGHGLTPAIYDCLRLLMRN